MKNAVVGARKKIRVVQLATRRHQHVLLLCVVVAAGNSSPLLPFGAEKERGSREGRRKEALLGVGVSCTPSSVWVGGLGVTNQFATAPAALYSVESLGERRYDMAGVVAHNRVSFRSRLLLK